MAYRIRSDTQSAFRAPFERPDKVHLRQEIKASRPPGGYPRCRKRDSGVGRNEVEDVGPPYRAADLSDDELAAIVAKAKLTVV